MDKILKTVEIKNRRASFDYTFLEKYVAGMVLTGTEIKSIRQGKASLADSYCVFINGELFVRNLQITEYEKARHFNHDPRRDKKLLLTATELKKIEKRLKDQGITIVPTFLFINDKGFAKLEIAVAKGKKTVDKREDIKKKDVEREIQRRIK